MKTFSRSADMSATKHNDVTAILLAGGQGSRMNHKDKAWVEYEGKPLVRHVLDRIEPQVGSVVISRHTGSERDATLPYTCIDDTRAGFTGPLAGIEACCGHVSTPQVLIVPCDTPALPTDLVDRLTDEMNDEVQAVVAHDGETLQVLVCLVRTRVLESITAYLDSGRRSVTGWIETLETRTASFAGQRANFKNINEINDLR